VVVYNGAEFQEYLAEFQSDCDFAKELSKVSPEIPRNPSYGRKPAIIKKRG
jgi:hypothetical protein